LTSGGIRREMGTLTEVTILSSSDVNPKYLDCVPWFIDFWLNQKSEIPGVTFRPLVLIVADALPPSLEKYSSHCQLVEVDLPGPFVSQNIRTLFASLVDSDIVATSDIDMLPMNSLLFDVAVSDIVDGGASTFVVLRDVLPAGQYAICYSVAAPSAWGSVFGLKSVSDVRSTLAELFESFESPDRYLGAHGGYGWFIDQEYLFEKVNQAADAGRINLTKHKDEETGHVRLDRMVHRGPLKWLAIPAIKKERYSDYHVHYPIAKNTRYLSRLLSIKQGS
jgi:hypothetical protein